MHLTLRKLLNNTKMDRHQTKVKNPDIEEGEVMDSSTTGKSNSKATSSSRVEKLHNFFESLSKTTRTTSKSTVRRIQYTRALRRYKKGLRGYRYNYPKAN